MLNNLKNRISTRKWLGAGCSTAALAGAWLAVSLLHPTVGKAITAVEMPALVFPEITAQANENVMLCVNNLTGDGSVRTLIGLLDVGDSTRFLRGSASMPGSFDSHRGACVLLLPAVMPAATAATARTGIPVVYLTGGGNVSGLVASVQLLAGDGSVRHVTTPTLTNRVDLPAVQ